MIKKLVTMKTNPNMLDIGVPEKIGMPITEVVIIV